MRSSEPVRSAIRADRYTIGKPHPDRAAQFKPFAALKGYYDLLEAEEQRGNAIRAKRAIEP